MPDITPLPPPAKLPVIVPPAPVPVPSPAQVYSAAAQNIAVAVCLTVAWLAGKVDTSTALAGLGIVAGIDFAHFLTRKLSPATATICFGATGVLHSLVKGLPGIIGVLALGTLLSSGCGADFSKLPGMVGNSLLAAERGYTAAESARAALCKDEDAGPCDVAAKDLARAKDALNEAVKVYTDMNDALKDPDAGVSP